MRRLIPLALICVSFAAACAPKEAMTDEQAQAVVKALPAPYNTANIANGKQIFQQCKSCHTAGKDGANMTGPNLYGVFGRKAGSHEGFNYSDAVRGFGFTWDADHLSIWLTSPKTFAPGTKMSFVGLPNAQDRIDVIGYLRTQSDNATP